MLKEPKLNDYVENLRSLKIAKIIEVNNQFGWFVVKYLDGYTKRHNSLGGSLLFVPLTKEQTADYLLKLANAGLLEEWQEGG